MAEKIKFTKDKIEQTYFPQGDGGFYFYKVDDHRRDLGVRWANALRVPTKIQKDSQLFVIDYRTEPLKTKCAERIGSFQAEIEFLKSVPALSNWGKALVLLEIPFLNMTDKLILFTPRKFPPTSAWEDFLNFFVNYFWGGMFLCREKHSALHFQQPSKDWFGDFRRKQQALRIFVEVIHRHVEQAASNDSEHRRFVEGVLEKTKGLSSEELQELKEVAGKDFSVF